MLRRVAVAKDSLIRLSLRGRKRDPKGNPSRIAWGSSLGMCWRLFGSLGVE